MELKQTIMYDDNDINFRNYYEVSLFIKEFGKWLYIKSFGNTTVGGIDRCNAFIEGMHYVVNYEPFIVHIENISKGFNFQEG